MTSGGPELTPELRAGRRALEGIADCQILGDFHWMAGLDCWALQLRLQPPDLAPSEFVPGSTDWFLLARHTYPDGSVWVCPARERGISHTFPHQILSSLDLETVPFRTGRICTDTSVKTLGHHEFDQEPRTSAGRIRWHVLRAIDWLVAASRGELILPGEPFELPLYPYEGPRRVGFLEDRISFAAWDAVSVRAGLVELVQYPRNERLLVVRQLATWKGEPLYRPSWGTRISGCNDVEVGVWVRLNELPVLPPWQPPATGRELQQAARRSGDDLLSRLEAVPDDLRDGNPHVLILGFPVAHRHGEPPEQLHWLAAELPPFTGKKQAVRGFRPDLKGARMRDRQRFLNMPLSWLRTDNWSEEEISSRGRLSPELLEKEILLIGAGSLGSAVAELLVRGGASKLTIVDGDRILPGNLVRHSLAMTDVGRSKAESLADWLNGLSPHARVAHVAKSFPPTNGKAVGGAEIVLDFTGDDDVLADLARFPWAGERWFASASLGLHARRLFLFIARASSLPRESMIMALQPWLAEERERFAGQRFRWEGIGCTSAVFPARIDDVRLFAAIVVKRLERRVGDPDAAAGLLVFEQSDSECVVRNLVEAEHA